jgi:hypothetical protein
VPIPGFNNAEVVGQDADGGYLISVNGGPPVKVAPQGLPGGALPASMSATPALPDTAVAAGVSPVVPPGRRPALSDGERTPAEMDAINQGLITREQLDARPTFTPPEPPPPPKQPWQMTQDEFAALQKQQQAAQGLKPAPPPPPKPPEKGEDKQELLPPSAFVQPGATPPVSPSGPMGAVQRSAMGATGTAPALSTPELEAYKQAEAKKQAAIAQEGELAQQQARAQLALEEQRAAQGALIQQKTQQWKQDADSEANRRKKEYDAAQKQQDDANNGKVDPNRYWNSRSTLQKAFGFLAAFFLGLAGKGIDDLMKPFEEDIDAQKEDLKARREGAKEKVARAYNALQIAYEKLGNMPAAQAALEAQGAKWYEEQARLLAAKTAEPGAKAKYEGLAADAAQKSAEKQIEVKQHIADSVYKQKELAFQQQRLQIDAAKAQAELNQKSGETTIPGMGEALDKEAAKEGRERVMAYRNTVALIGRLMTLRDKYGPQVFPSEGAKEMQSVATQLLGALNRQQKFGAMDNGTQELLTRMAGGDPTALRSPVPALRAIKRSLDDSFAIDTEALTGKKPGAATFEGKK